MVSSVGPRAYMPHDTLSSTTGVDTQWDHKVYVYNTTGFAGMKSQGTWYGSNHIDKEKLDFPLGALHDFKMYTIKGSFRNMDLYTTPLPFQSHNNNNNIDSNESKEICNLM